MAWRLFAYALSSVRQRGNWKETSISSNEIMLCLTNLPSSIINHISWRTECFSECRTNRPKDRRWSKPERMPTSTFFHLMETILIYQKYLCGPMRTRAKPVAQTICPGHWPLYYMVDRFPIFMCLVRGRTCERKKRKNICVKWILFLQMWWVIVVSRLGSMTAGQFAVVWLA